MSTEICSEDRLLAGWSRDLAELLARLDEPALPLLLDAALRRLAPFDLSVAFAYPDDHGPLLLHDGLRGTGERSALDAYLCGTYLLDPFYLACVQRVPPGLYRMSALAPDKFFDSDYVRSPEVHPCISMESGTLTEEIGFLVPLVPGFMAAYSLMRSNGGALFEAEALARLHAVEPVVRHVVAQHWRLLPRSPGAPGRRAQGDVGGLEAAFAGFAPERLTRQQQRIVQLILRGHSTASIAARLGIAIDTAKTHRRAVYDRLGISGQAELFTAFVRYLIG